MKKDGIKMLFPEEGLVYDYKLDDAGASQMNVQDEGEDEEKKKAKSNTIQWLSWMHDVHIPKVVIQYIIRPYASNVRRFESTIGLSHISHTNELK